MSEIIKDGKHVELAYTISVADGDEYKQVYEFTRAKPEVIVFGHEPGLLEGFSKALSGLTESDKFTFALKPEEAFGNRDANLLIKVDKSTFEVEGEFDSENVKPGVYVPMRTPEGYAVDGLVTEVGDKTVTLDFNHPLAGFTVRYSGKVLVVRDATPEELEPHHCGCGCGHHHDDCGCEHGDCEHKHQHE